MTTPAKLRRADFTVLDSPVPCAILLYIVNVKDDYKHHKVFKTCSSAKATKKQMCERLGLRSTEVFVTRMMAFVHEDTVFCTNGFNYKLSEIVNGQ